jgi:glucose-6-phosphate 1-epimerase
MSNQVIEKNFKLEPELKFSKDEQGLEFIEIDNQLAVAKIALQGAHVMLWQPKSAAEPVLWLSSQARYVHGRSIRGGVPICWPWFGAHPTDSSYCPHGFARVIPWQLIDADTLQNGATRLVLQIIDTPIAKKQLSYPYTLTLTITIGETLKLDLATTNHGSHPFMIGEAYHTYFKISDIAKVKVSGLEDAIYSDKVLSYERSVQHGSIKFNGEFDRVYLNSSADCIIEDAGLKRKIRVGKSGSSSTVVWSPGADKAHQMGDMGTVDEWRSMLCIEIANAMENSVIVNPNQTHILTAEYSVEDL